MLTIEFETLRLKDGDRVLDLGCGEGRHVHNAFTAAEVHAVGVDLSYDNVRATADGFLAVFGPAEPETRRWSVSAGDALRLPFADNSFDAIVCSEVLEHIPEYQAALREMDRLLKPGGTLAVSVPRFGPEWVCWKLSSEYSREPGGHIRIFRAPDLQREIEDRSYACYRTHWAHGLHSPYWWLQCALWNSRHRSFLVRAYHKLLVWDLTKKPWITRIVEKLLNPVIGKSVVFYFKKVPVS